MLKSSHRCSPRLPSPNTFAGKFALRLSPQLEEAVFGTPTGGGQFQFTANISDPAGNRTTANFDLMIYPPGSGYGDACAVHGDNSVHVAELQSLVNQAFGMAKPTNDLNGDGVVNMVDVQTAVSALLTSACIL